MGGCFVGLGKMFLYIALAVVLGIFVIWVISLFINLINLPQ